MSQTSKSPQKKPVWIASARYDLPLIVLAPTLAMLLGGVCWFAIEQQALHGSRWLRVLGEVAVGIFLVAVIQGHLLLVLVRANLNPKVRGQFPRRFLLAPLFLMGIQILSPWACIGLSVLAVYWDVYHSSLQTFGFGRIYDGRAGNDPLQGRRMDMVFNIVVYIAPILAGANLIEHVTTWEQFSLVGATALAGAPEWVASVRPMLVQIGIGVTLVGVVGYGLGLWRMRQQGYRMPWPKAVLYANTGVVSVLAWGLMDPIYAFFVMNLFHAVQYYAIVWAMESKGLSQRLGFHERAQGKGLLLFLVVGFTLAYGYLLPFITSSVGSDPNSYNLGFWALAVMNTVSILHFWYDGFIWSVRKKAV
jgi:hypothetical protein